ncbi:MAG: Omp28-related outer membrane protein [candidate division WOR-3 bacterium]
MSKKIFSLIFIIIILGACSQLIAVQRVVLAEDFTGTWCQYCPGAQMGLQILKGQVKDSLAILAYHLSDPFTIPECNTRSSYYGVSGIPHVKFDGVLTRVGGYYNQPVNYRDLYDARQTIPPPVKIYLSNTSYNLVSGNGEVSVTVINVSNTNIQAVLRLAMVGKETAYVWQSQSYLYDVVLGMFPNAASGQPISINQNDTFTQNYNYTIPTAWRGGHCAIVAFLQNDNTKEVYNAFEQTASFSNINDESRQTIHHNKLLTFTNPTTNPVKFYLNLSKITSVRLNIYDAFGKLINTFDEFNNNEIIWNLTGLNGKRIESGVYFVELNCANQKHTYKLVVAK